MYYPILRWKKGEQVAVSNLYDDSIAQMTPIWWLTELDDLDKIKNNLDKAWKTYSIIDVSRLGNIDALLSLISTIIDKHNVGIMLTPHQIQTLDSSFKRDYASVISVRVDISETGIDLDPETHLNIIGELNQLDELTEKEILILFDYGALSEFDEGIVADVSECLEIYLSYGYSEIAFASGAFPPSLASIVGTEFIPRADKKTFEELRDTLSHDLLYSDYSVFSPQWDPSGRGIPFVNIRYALDNHWMIIRDTDRGAEASCAVAGILVMSDEYKGYGPSFSWADERWQYKVDTNKKPGGPTEHIAEAHNHHLTQVAKRS